MAAKHDSQKFTKTVKQDIFLTYLGNVDFSNLNPQTIAALEQSQQNLDSELGNLISIRKRMPVVAATSILLGSLPQDTSFAKKIVKVLKKSDHETSLQPSEEKVQKRSNNI